MNFTLCSLASATGNKQEVKKPEQNVAQHCAKAESCVQEDLMTDKLRKGWRFQVGTWNHRRRTHRGNGSFAPVLQKVTGQKYPFAPVLFGQYNFYSFHLNEQRCLRTQPQPVVKATSQLVTHSSCHKLRVGHAKLCRQGG